MPLKESDAKKSKTGLKVAPFFPKGLLIIAYCADDGSEDEDGRPLSEATAVSISWIGPMIPVTSVREPTAAPMDTEAGRQPLQSFKKLTEALMTG